MFDIITALYCHTHEMTGRRKKMQVPHINVSY